MDVAQGTQTRLAYEGLVEWATSGRLARSVDGEEWVGEAPVNTDDPSHSLEVAVNETTFFRIEVANVAGTTFSRVLTVRVS